MMRRIGILTGGGDVPGLNAAIKAFVQRMEEEGREVLGLRRGWASLINVRPGDEEHNRAWLTPLDRHNTRRIDRTGGTMLHSSRLNPALLLPNQIPEHLRGTLGEAAAAGGTFDFTPRVAAAISDLGLDAVVAIGGDGTLSFAQRLHREGVPVIAIPKTMDNDVHGTDYSIGFSTAVTRSVQFIHNLRTAAGSHERLLIVELFGRHSGEPCLLSSYLAGVERALIAEVPYDEERVIDLLARDKRDNPSHYAVLTISEGAHPVEGQPLDSGQADAVGHRKLGGIGAVFGDAFQKRTGERTLYQPLGYLMRSGPPDALDQLVANNLAGMAADQLLAGKSGLLMAVVGGRYAAVSIERLGEGIRRVDVDRFYDTREYRPKVVSVMGLPMFLH